MSISSLVSHSCCPPAYNADELKYTRHYYIAMMKIFRARIIRSNSTPDTRRFLIRIYDFNLCDYVAGGARIKHKLNAA